MALNNQFWQGLDPTKPERLSKVLAALHCFHIAPPTDLFHCEFTVHPTDHHRIYDGFPELQLLEKLIDRNIYFHFDASTGTLATMDFTPYHADVVDALSNEIHVGLRSLRSHPGSVGALAQQAKRSTFPLIMRGGGADRDGKPTDITQLPALSYRSSRSIDPTVVLDFAGHQVDAPSKHARYIIKHHARTAVSLRLSFTTTAWLGEKAKYTRMADNSAVWVWTTVDGRVQPIVQKEPLSTPDGQIKLWLSDFVPMAEITKLPSEFVRPLRDEAERAANISIPFSVILDTLKDSSDVAFGVTESNPLPPFNTNQGQPAADIDAGGRRFFSSVTRGAPAYRKPVAGATFDPAVAARRASAVSVGRFSTRFLRAFRK